jgi:hypothetical protein
MACKPVLKWGNQPQDLDMYVIPMNVVDKNKKDVTWTMPMGQVIIDYQFLPHASSRSFRPAPLPTC